jgi:DNA-3-methyladenine glycosylase I
MKLTSHNKLGTLPRCPWAEGDPFLARYHDEEWGVPVAGDAAHFERLSLEVFQAGLSWRTILYKRAAFRRAFARFSPGKVAAFTKEDIRRLLGDAGIVRNRMKIEATIENARRLLALSKAHGSFARWLDSLPADLKALQGIFRQEFRFMGPEIAKSYLESVGKVPIRHHPRCRLAPRGAAKPGA